MFRIPFWLLLVLSFPALADEAVVRQTISPSDYARAREALQDAIENQGLIAGPSSRFGEMLARTGQALGRSVPVYEQAEILSFCSATVSWELINESPDNIALCPLTIALYTLPGAAGTVYLSYRAPGSATPGQRRATALLRDIAAQTVSSARRISAGAGSMEAKAGTGSQSGQ